MKFIPTKLPGCFIIEPAELLDNRGSFVKLYNKTVFTNHNININSFREVFYSTSRKNVIRGMHYQRDPFQIAKLITCTEGEILDVFLDIRPESKTYGQFDSHIISEKQKNYIYLPEGIARGFLALSDVSKVFYLQSDEHNQAADSGISWNSFGMEWKLKNPILSERDHKFPTFDNHIKNPQ
jgi:dTDP-4-dehydrorhamnose 3,5-epimerase